MKISNSLGSVKVFSFYLIANTNVSEILMVSLG